MGTSYILSNKATFENGRVEEYVQCATLTVEEMSDPIFSRAIAVKMCELHSLPVKMPRQALGTKPKACLWDMLYSWMDIADGLEVRMKSSSSIAFQFKCLT